MKQWNAGKDRKVKKWIDPDWGQKKDRLVAWVIVGIVFFAIFVGIILGVSLGRMERDCQFMVDYDLADTLPNYCSMFRVHEA